jgi:hypothetical protein
MGGKANVKYFIHAQRQASVENLRLGGSAEKTARAFEAPVKLQQSAPRMGSNLGNNGAAARPLVRSSDKVHPSGQPSVEKGEGTLHPEPGNTGTCFGGGQWVSVYGSDRQSVVARRRREKNPINRNHGIYRERESQGVEKSRIFAWTRPPRVMCLEVIPLR